MAHGPQPLNSTRRHSPFLKSTGDIRHSDIRQGTEIDSDMRHCHFLNSTCDMGINKRQRYATWGPTYDHRRCIDNVTGDYTVSLALLSGFQDFDMHGVWEFLQNTHFYRIHYTHASKHHTLLLCGTLYSLGACTHEPLRNGKRSW